MVADNVQEAVELARKLGHIFVGTADRNGLSHIAAAAELQEEANGRLGVSAWFCPGTAANLQQNRMISLVIWDPASDRGFQIAGEVEAIVETAIMNGYAPEINENRGLPQTRDKLIVRVDKIYLFRLAPHGDKEMTSEAED